MENCILGLGDSIIAYRYSGGSRQLWAAGALATGFFADFALSL
jgi:hypothetical protein